MPRKKTEKTTEKLKECKDCSSYVKNGVDVRCEYCAELDQRWKIFIKNLSPTTRKVMDNYIKLKTIKHATAQKRLFDRMNSSFEPTFKVIWKEMYTESPERVQTQGEAFAHIQECGGCEQCKDWPMRGEASVP